MKKTIAAVLLAASLVCSLTACSGQDNNASQTANGQSTVSAQTANGSLAGSYTLISYVKDASPVNISANGNDNKMELKEDGTGVFKCMGTDMSVTFDANSVTINGGSGTYTLSGDSLTIVSGSSTMVFKKDSSTAGTDQTASQPTASQPTASQPTASQPTASQPTASQPTTQTSSDADSKVKVTDAAWQNIEWEHYSDPKGRFTADIPKGWVVDVADGLEANRIMGLLITVKTSDDKYSAQVFDYTTISTNIMTEPTVESLIKALYTSSKDIKITESTVTDQLKAIKDANPGNILDAKMVRMSYTKNNINYEGAFLGFVNKSLIANTYAATTMWAGAAPVGEYQNWADVFTKIQTSIEYTDSYRNRNKSSGNSSSGNVVSGGLSSTTGSTSMSDMMMDSWNARNKSQDIMSQKQQDATLGHERVYDTQTGDIYIADSGFMEQYDKLDGQRYAAATDDMYTEGYSGYLSF